MWFGAEVEVGYVSFGVSRVGLDECLVVLYWTSNLVDEFNQKSQYLWVVIA